MEQVKLCISVLVHYISLNASRFLVVAINGYKQNIAKICEHLLIFRVIDRKFANVAFVCKGL